MQVYKNILVTIDCSSVDEKILDHVALLARQNNAKVVLLHVVHSHTLDQERALREKAQTILNRYLKKLQTKGVKAAVLIRSGEPEKEILDEIETNKYDLVAMGTHGHRLLGDILFGSVSDTLKHKISVPLLLIKGE
jgi:universal stress protein A